MRSSALVAALLLTSFASVACGDDPSSASGCGSPVREDLDPLFALHPIDAEGIEYQTSPPTSGPHLSITGPTGVQTEPLGDAIQVTVLARGAVLVQYRDDADAAALEELADHATVVVAPAPDLPDRIVATAWTWKMSCGDLDPAALGEFVDEFAGIDHH